MVYCRCQGGVDLRPPAVGTGIASHLVSVVRGGRGRGTEVLPAPAVKAPTPGEGGGLLSVASQGTTMTGVGATAGVDVAAAEIGITAGGISLLIVTGVRLRLGEPGLLHTGGPSLLLVCLLGYLQQLVLLLVLLE